jgi:hypothetical protein
VNYVLLMSWAVAALLGALPLPRWTIVVIPAISLAWGVSSYLKEEPGYDMPGFSLWLGAIYAGASVVSWLIGRGVALLVGKIASS